MAPLCAGPHRAPGGVGASSGMDSSLICWWLLTGFSRLLATLLASSSAASAARPRAHGATSTTMPTVVDGATDAAAAHVAASRPRHHRGRRPRAYWPASAAETRAHPRRPPSAPLTFSRRFKPRGGNWAVCSVGFKAFFAYLLEWFYLFFSDRNCFSEFLDVSYVVFSFVFPVVFNACFPL